MFLVVHASLGAVIGSQVQSPYVAAPLGFLSHFLIDIIPHGDEAIGRLFIKSGRHMGLVFLAVVDALSALCLITLLWMAGLLPNAIGAFVGAVAAMVPDILSGFTIVSKGKFLPDFDWVHGLNHRLLGFEAPFWAGGSVQMITLVSIWTYQLVRVLQ